jgi:hypothetical protein
MEFVPLCFSFLVYYKQREVGDSKHKITDIYNKVPNNKGIITHTT